LREADRERTMREMKWMGRDEQIGRADSGK